MYAVMVASECAPVAQTGGLGDVVFGLSRELEIRGNAVEIILPKYDRMRYDRIWGLTKSFNDLWVPWYGGAIHCSVWFGFVEGRKCFFIEPHSRDNFFSRGAYYGMNDDAMRFAFFSKAALEFMLKAGKRPDIIHCHDWQTGLLPVLLFEIYKYHGMPHQRVCYTVHNFRHQGVAGTDILQATGLSRPEYFLHHDRLRDNANRGAINFMKGGIVYSNFVTTVSPQHAWEARCTDQGFGLGPTLNIHSGKFAGVLNGLDYDSWNPEIDRHLPVRYGPNNVQGKYRDKEALRHRLWLRQDFKPIIAYVGRLDDQKGVDLIRQSLFYALDHGVQFVLLGSSSTPAIEERFGGLKRRFNDHPDIHLELSFNAELSHLIYAGSDILVMPSLYEPCGLAQLIALKYGTIPVVRAIGGLCDTVFDAHHSGKPQQERNGFVFHQTDPPAVESALHRAVGLWHSYPEEFRELMLNGMRQDYSWSDAGSKYLGIYDYIRHK